MNLTLYVENKKESEDPAMRWLLFVSLFMQEIDKI